MRQRKLLYMAVAAGVLAGAMAGSISSIAYQNYKNQAAIIQEEIETVPAETIERNITIVIETEAEPETVPETEALTERIGYRWSDEEAYLLAKLAMAEAEGEDKTGKALVILTVLNRVESDRFPNTVSKVIYQKNAFTPVWNGRFDRVEPNAECWGALAMVERGWDGSNGALYFERTTTASTWHSRNLTELFEWGNHTFYAEGVDAK